MGSTQTEVKPENDKAKARRLVREAKALEAEAAAKKAEASATIGQPVEEIVRPQRVRKVAKATGHGLSVTGKAIIDTDLRDVGKGFKRLGRFVKDHTPTVRVETVNTIDNDESSTEDTTAVVAS